MAETGGERALSLFRRRWISEAILAAANLGVADHMDEKPVSASALAEAVGAHPEALYRLMRALAHQGVFQESEGRSFSHTPASWSLRSDHPESVVSIIRAAGLTPFRVGATRYDHAIRTGNSGIEEALGTGPFEYLSAHPDESSIYDDSQKAATRLQSQAILGAYDFTAMRTLVDVGGGAGALLAAILAEQPALRGVLFDQPHVVEAAASVLSAHGVEERCQVVGGDFRTEVPDGGDGYILKHCLHGWDDESSIEIVRRIHAAARPGSRLLIIENVMTSQPSEMVDAFELFLLLGGVGSRVRTEDEFRAILSAGGYELERVISLRGFGAIVDGRRRNEGTRSP